MDAADRLRRAETLLELQRPEAAERLIREYLTHAPEDPEAWLLLSIAGCDQERYDEAIYAAREALARAPENDVALFHLGRALLCAGRHEEALRAAGAAIAADPEQPRHQALRARALHLMDRDREALTAAQAGLALDPDDVELQQLSAYAMLHSGRLKDARTMQARVLRSAPDDKSSHHLKALTALHAARYGEAERHFREALRLDPHFGGARNGLLETLRARFWPYRLWQAMLLYQMRTSRWVFLLWVLVGMGLMMAFSWIPFVGKYLTLAVLCALVLLAVMVRLGHITTPMADAFVLLRPRGRDLLGWPERIRAVLAVACIGLIAAFTVSAVRLDRIEFGLLTVAWFAMLVLVAWSGASAKPLNNRIHAVITLGFALLAAGATGGYLFEPEPQHIAVACTLLFGVGFIGYFFLRPLVLA